MSGPYEVRVASAAQRQLRALPIKIAGAIVEFITAVLPENPIKLSKQLAGDFAPFRSARRGDYRVLVLVDEETRRLLVVRVAHRADAYRHRQPAERSVASERGGETLVTPVRSGWVKND